MSRFTFLRATVCAVALASLTSFAQTSASAQDLFDAPANSPTQVAVFDSMTGVTTATGGVGAAPNTGNTYMGGAQILETPQGAVVQQITGLDTVLVNNSGAALSLTGLRLRVQFWGDAVVANDPNFFANPLSGVTFNFTIAPGTPFVLNNNTFSPFYNLQLATPVSTVFSDFLGTTFNWQGATNAGGTNFADIPGLSTAIRGGANQTDFAAGSTLFTQPLNGYLRNASGRTDFNFNSGVGNAADSRNVGNFSSLALRLYAATPTVVPESNTLALLAFGVAPVVGTVIARRRKK